MSFFGFDSTLPRDKPHNTKAPGFGLAPDPFAGLSSRQLDAEDGAIDFDTYDGLGDQLDESADAFNDDTFGIGLSANKDFDFSGQTSQMSGTMQDEQMLFHARQPAPRMSPKKADIKPARSGYEKYSQPGFIPNLEAEASIWGLQPKATSSALPSLEAATRKMLTLEEVEAANQARSSPRKMMSVEEVEAAMQASREKGTPSSISQLRQQPITAQFPSAAAPLAQQNQHHRLLSREGAPVSHGHIQAPTPPIDDYSAPNLRPGLPVPPHAPGLPSSRTGQFPGSGIPTGPRNANNRPAWERHQVTSLPAHPNMATEHNRGPSYSGRPLKTPEQLLNMSDAERAAYVEEDARRAKRAHKIQQMSRYNGFMTPQDKNFIVRIQLSQLMTALGVTEDGNPESARTTDFYYHVFRQIRGPPRQDPNQPMNQFAQAYLPHSGQQAGRRVQVFGAGQMRRMEQQVQRAVEAAKNRPKVSQVNIEGSLGKIAFSNAKTPKPLLNLKRPEGQLVNATTSKTRQPSASDAKTILRNIEGAYSALMLLEDHERRQPPPPPADANVPEEFLELQALWTAAFEQLFASFWSKLKVQVPIDPSSPEPHPFISMVSVSKGKKLIPRAFRQMNEQQRLTVLALLMIHLDKLDVVEKAYNEMVTGSVSSQTKEQIELFQNTISQCFFNLVAESTLETAMSFIELITEHTNLQVVLRTKIGVSLFTIFISHAEIMKQSGQASEQTLVQWAKLFDLVFSKLEPQLGSIFPADALSGVDDIYVWQFLAAVGIGASESQQHRLVMAVKDQVIDTVNYAKTLPDDFAKPKLDNVNLFMKAFGLSVDMLGG